jgi:hypothetical protein
MKHIGKPRVQPLNESTKTAETDKTIVLGFREKAAWNKSRESHKRTTPRTRHDQKPSELAQYKNVKTKIFKTQERRSPDG